MNRVGILSLILLLYIHLLKMVDQYSITKSDLPPSVNGSLVGINTHGLENCNFRSYRSWCTVEAYHTQNELNDTLCDNRPFSDNVGLHKALANPQFWDRRLFPISPTPYNMGIVAILNHFKYLVQVQLPVPGTAHPIDSLRAAHLQGFMMVKVVEWEAEEAERLEKHQWVSVYV
jgi:hypothetical protein